MFSALIKKGKHWIWTYCMEIISEYENILDIVLYEIYPYLGMILASSKSIILENKDLEDFVHRRVVVADLSWCKWTRLEISSYKRYKQEHHCKKIYKRTRFLQHYEDCNLKFAMYVTEYSYRFSIFLSTSVADLVSSRIKRKPPRNTTEHFLFPRVPSGPDRWMSSEINEAHGAAIFIFANNTRRLSVPARFIMAFPT